MNRPATQNSRLFFSDTIGYFYAFVPGLFSWSVTIFYINQLWETYFLIPGVLLVPCILVLSFISITFILQRILPKLKPGLYRVDQPHPQIIIWHLNNCLGDALDISGLKPLVFRFYITKYLYWRAAGAKIEFGIISSILLTMREYPLLSIKKGTCLSGFVHVSAHTFQGDKLLLAPIEIGSNVFVGMNSIIGPKTKIGDNAWVGANNSRVFPPLFTINTNKPFPK